jgi:uncharacterized protein YcfL
MNKKFVLGAALVSILMVGCSSIKPYEGLYVSKEKIIDDKLLVEHISQVRIYRSEAMLQKFATLNISIDGQLMATLKNDSAKVINIKPGKHRVESKMGALDGKSGCGFDFQSSEGEIIYIIAGPSGTGASVPIISVLANPMVCKFNISPVGSTNNDVIEKIDTKI